MLNLTSGRSYIHMTLNFGNILKWETIVRALIVILISRARIMVFSSIILINNHRLVTTKTKKKQSSFPFLESSFSQHQVNSIASSGFLICPHLCITFHQPLQMVLINIQPQKPSYEVLKLIDVSLLNKTPTKCS